VASNVEDLIIKIQADTTNTSASMKVLVDQLAALRAGMEGVKTSTQGVESKLGGFGAAMIVMRSTIENAKMAFDLISAAAEKTVGAFLKSEDGIIRLSNTMRTLGEKDIKSAVAGFKEFAAQMQETTSVEDDQVISLLNIAKAAGVSNEQAKILIKTSADLAATGRGDLTSAFNGLLKSLKGSTMGLSVMVPELVDMNKEAAKAGDAIRYVQATLGGLAENELKTTAGQLAQASNRFSDLQEGVGEAIAAMLGMKPGVSIINELVKNMSIIFNENKETIIKYGKEVVDVFKGLYAAFSILKDNLVVVAQAAGLAAAAFGLAFLALKTSAVGAASTSILTMARAWGAAQVASLGFAIQMGLVALGIVTVIVAIDLLIKNLTNLPNLFSSVMNTIMTGLGVVAEAIVSFTGNEELKKKVEEFTNFSAAKAVEAGKDINTGIGGSIVEQIGKMKGEWSKATAELSTTKIGVDVDTGGGPKSAKPTIVSQATITALEEIDKKNKELGSTIAQADMLQIDRLQEKSRLEQEAFAAKYKALGITRENNAMLDETLKKMQSITDEESKKAPSREFETAQKGGTDIAKQISGAFAGGLSGVAGAVTGMMSAAGAVMEAVSGAVAFVQKLIDFIPAILNAVANIFNTLADLPLKVLEGVKNVFKGLGKFITDFLPNLITSIVDVFFTILKGLFIELPKAFMQLFKTLPGLILDVIKDIPTLVAEVVEGLISFMPEMAISFVNSIVANAPKIMFAIARLFYVEIPKAIIRGVINGIQKIASAFGSLFKGGAKVEIDTKQATEAMKKAAKALTGEAGKLFKVMDLTDGPIGDKAKSLLQDVEDAGDNVKNWLLEAWQYILDRLNAFVSVLKDTWDNIINALKEVWNFVKGFLEAFVSAFKGITEALKQVVTQITDAGKQIWEGFVSLAGQAGQFFTNMGANIWDGLKSGLSNLGPIFENALNAINPSNLLQKMFANVGQGKGSVEEALSKLTRSNIDVPFANFAAGGRVPGTAVVGGDSIMNDRVLALLSPGEAVIPRSLMKNKAIQSIVDNVLEGNIKPQAFRAGGWVGQQQDKAASADPTTGGGGIAGKIVRNAAGEITSVAQDAYTSGQEAANQAAQAANDAGGYASEKYKAAVKWLEQFDPSKLWDQLKERGFNSLGDMWTNAPLFHEGGVIGGQGDVPVIGQANEFIIRRPAVKSLGLGNLSEMNRTGRLPDSGGVVSNFDVTINITAGGTPDERFIRNTMVPMIKEELRRASLDGQRVVYKSGVRG